MRDKVSRNLILEQEKEMRTQAWLFDEIMNHTNTCVCVTELYSDNILFMNKKMKELYGVEQPEGRACWKILKEGMEKRCSFCPKQRLLEQKENPGNLVWQEERSETGRIFENQDSLITWTDGSTVHLRRTIDITDQMIRDKQEAMDKLCGVLNRRVGKECLQKTINNIKLFGGQAVVSLIDVNDLKVINEKSGHEAGNQALVFICDILKKNLGQEDYVFRLGGDEFVIVFIGKSERQAEIVLAKCLMESMKTKRPAGERVTFCCGHYLITQSCRLNGGDVIACADKNMYQNKLRYHQNKMAADLEALPPAGKDKESFSFDTALLYDALIRSTDDFIYVCNMKTGIFSYSPLLVRELGLPSEIMEHPLPFWKKVVHPHDWEVFYRANMEIGDGKTDYHSVEFRARQVNGEYQWLRCRGYLMRDEYGTPSVFAGFMYKMDKQNKIDSLTSLLSIHELSKDFDLILKNNYYESIAMIMVGLDNFKNLNDLYNREFGNQVLRGCGKILQELISERVTVYRMDGDKFGILVQRPKEGEIISLFQGIRNRLLDLPVLKDTNIIITASAGAIFYPQNANSYLDMVKYGEYALQHSKEHGKNCLTFFHQDILTSKSRNLRILKELQKSVNHDFEGFYLLFQPQVDAVSGTITGAEALLRFKDEQLGAVSPGEFIPILEENQLINPVGQWVLEQAVDTLKRFTTYDESFTISVNLSYLQLLDTAYMKGMIEAIKASGVRPENVILELTESYLVKSMKQLQQIFGELRKCGIRVAMDDFGSGYSSLELLKNATFDIVKVDKAFVEGILKSRFDASFMECIIKLCHDVDIYVCLEGVEYEAEYQMLKDMKPDSIQGYYFGKPQTYQDIIRDYLM